MTQKNLTQSSKPSKREAGEIYNWSRVALRGPTCRHGGHRAYERTALSFPPATPTLPICLRLHFITFHLFLENINPILSEFISHSPMGRFHPFPQIFVCLFVETQYQLYYFILYISFSIKLKYNVTSSHYPYNHHGQNIKYHLSRYV